jgi:hypothetical protein
MKWKEPDENLEREEIENFNISQMILPKSCYLAWFIFGN